MENIQGVNTFERAVYRTQSRGITNAVCIVIINIPINMICVSFTESTRMGVVLP